MRKDILVSVVAPVYNEMDVINQFIEETLAVLSSNFENYELILVDDGSTDLSAMKIKESQLKSQNIRLIRLSRNYGREIALTAGLESSIGDYVILMDSDLQDPPDLIPDFLSKALEGFDVVYGARTEREGESILKKWTSRNFYRLASYMTGFNIPENAGDFRLLNRKVANAILELKESNRYLKLLYAYVGFRTASIPFKRRRRFAGITKYNYNKLINAALDAIISFSIKPLRIVSILSILVSGLLSILSIYALIAKLMSREGIADGWTSLFLLNSSMFCLVFIFMAMIAEYVGRSLTESKGRPLYFIQEETNSSVLKLKNIADDV